MDASEHDLDAWLYKASAELLSELQAKLPSLVRTPGPNDKVRRWVIGSKIYEIDALLDRFQEWPQLLDPHLSSLVQILVESFLYYCVECPEDYLRQHDHHAELWPLPQAIASVLYTFCKVRGQKVIVRLLNNEPKYVEPLLTCFHLWTSHVGSTDRSSGMMWEQQYIMLLWLSHLMLAPFELSSISALVGQSSGFQYETLMDGLPEVAQNLLKLALDHSQVPSKAREAACNLAVRLALRRDMQALNLPGRLVFWIVRQLETNGKDAKTTGYHSIGLLSLLFGLSNSASNSEAAPFVDQVFRLVHNLTITTTPSQTVVKDSAPARKLLIKIMRTTVIHAISLSSKNSTQGNAIDLNSLLEDCIQALLDYLSDNDTPVRQAASKALSLIALQLEADMSAEVGEAVLGCLDENILLENNVTGELFARTDLLRDDTVMFKQSVNAVDPLRWHGAMLTLGHLLFRKALPPSQLPSIVKALLIGLEFEQRSSVGTSIGVGVRDAACFGLWSLARKYSTVELSQVPVSATMVVGNVQHVDSAPNSVIQVIATHLVVSACLDPSGNLRRGSSAALQELIGRHPDVITQGIPVVQVVDYHAVARRSNAMIEVATAAAKLDPQYHQALLYSLLQWRGARAIDVDSRRQAAIAVGQLVLLASQPETDLFLKTLLTDISNLKETNIGSNASARHGFLLALSAIVRVLHTRTTLRTGKAFKLLLPLLHNFSSMTGDIDGRTTSDIENVLEATSHIISTAAEWTGMLKISAQALAEVSNIEGWISRILPVLEHCTTATEKDVVTESAAMANIKVFEVISEDSQVRTLSLWLNTSHRKTADFICKGRIVTLGMVFSHACTSQHLMQFTKPIVAYFCDIIEGNATIETKVNAMQSLGRILNNSFLLSVAERHRITATINNGLSNYTIDQRGDVGSLLRLETMKTLLSSSGPALASADMRLTQQLIVKLAAEKLGKVRFQAWSCLLQIWSSTGLPMPQNKFLHQSDVSSLAYFKSLLQLIKIPHLRDHLILGLISSLSAGTDEIGRACTEAVVITLLEQESPARFPLILSMIMFLIRHLDRLSKQDDRDVVPALDFLTFLLDHVLPLAGSDGHTEVDCNQLWGTSQKVHGPSASIARLEAMVRLYTTFSSIADLRIKALDRLSRMLLHRWPKIRSSAAESIYALAYTSSIVDSDWNAPVAESKPIVLQLRKELGVAGAAVK